MSDDRPKTVFPKLLMLDQPSIDFLREEALLRNPVKGGSRAQSGVARDALAFASAHRVLFRTWIAAPATRRPIRRGRHTSHPAR